MANYETFAPTLSSDMTKLDGAITTQDGDLKSLDTAISQLDNLIRQLDSAANATSASGGSGSTKPSNTSTSPAAKPSIGTTASPASASQLAADQAAIDAAQAQLTAANQNLAAATLTSPIAGTIAAVELTVGTSSSGKSITILGPGTQDVITSVPLTEVGQVKPGQPAIITADGISQSLHGTVASIGLLSTSSGSNTTFPVTVTIDPGSPHLFDGSGADIIIDTATAANAITIPNSAIHTGRNSTHTVTVVKNAKSTTVPVTLGVEGTDITQVKTGLNAGEQVVIADPSQPLPSSANTATATTTTGFGGFGGGAARSGG
jgi:multidrug efflux pump subunit AcrA (membrane-fusion protein)